ncbi:MAG: agmatine deiminase family protein [Pseudomonadota bacterium]
MATPREEGFFMPAEWTPHSRCLMAWPVRLELWDDRLEAARDAYSEVAQAISQFEPVTLLTPPEELASASMRTGGKVSTLPLPINDSWMRDNGPTFVVNEAGTVAGVDWIFNAWGEGFEHYDLDDAVPAALLERAGLRRFRAPLVLEGGSIHVDGAGSLVTTESCLLNPNRNPSLSKQQIEQHLKDYLGVSNIIWLFGDPLEEGTNGHVDNLACFIAPGKVLALVPANDKVQNREALEENLRRLRAAKDANGQPLEVIEVPQPQRIHEDYHGEMFHGSYINFYIANGGIVMPSFEDPNDRVARSIIEAAFPDREVVVVPGSDVVYGGGCFHCITQQQPLGAE